MSQPSLPEIWNFPLLRRVLTLVQNAASRQAAFGPNYASRALLLDNATVFR